MTTMKETRWRILMVEDEVPARRYLRKLLASRGDAEVVGEAMNVEDAFEIWQSQQPNLILLDIQLAHSSGFDLLPLLVPMPKVIFVTAFDQFAVRAFEVNAVDYLLKPVTAARLDQALSKASLLPAMMTEEPSTSPPYVASDSVFLQTSRSLMVVTMDQITSIRADGNFTHVSLVDGSVHFISRLIGEWCRRLPEEIFVRLDRSTLVNRHHMRGIRWISRDHGQLLLTGAMEEGMSLGRTALVRAKELLKDE